MFDEAVSLTFPAEAAPLAVAYTDTAINRSHNTFFRGDFLATPNHTFSGRFLQEIGWEIGDNWQANRSLPENVEYERNGGDRTYNTAWSWVIGNQATNEMKVGRIPQDTSGARRRSSTRMCTGLRAIPPGDHGPRRAASSTSARGTHTPITMPARPPGTAPRSRTTTRGTTRSRWSAGLGGDHTFKAGAGYFRGYAAPRSPAAISWGRSCSPRTGRSIRRMPSTYPSQFSIRLGSIYTFAEDHRWYGFVQDRWQIDKLTLNLGLRWDYQTLTPNTKAALGPRVGVAWDPMGNARTVIRGGFGRTTRRRTSSSGPASSRATWPPTRSSSRPIRTSRACRGAFRLIRACSPRWDPPALPSSVPRAAPSWRAYAAPCPRTNSSTLSRPSRTLIACCPMSGRSASASSASRRRPGGVGGLRRQPGTRYQRTRRYQRTPGAAQRHPWSSRRQRVRPRRHVDSGAIPRRRVSARAAVPESGRVQHRPQRAGARPRKAVIEPMERTGRLYPVRIPRRAGRQHKGVQSQPQAILRRPRPAQRLRPRGLRQPPRAQHERYLTAWRGLGLGAVYRLPGNPINEGRSAT